MAEPRDEAARRAVAVEVVRRTLRRGADHVGDSLSDAALLRATARFAEAAAAAVERGGRLFACGNGGSLADAMHFAAEWTGRFRDDRRAWPAVAFSDPVTLSCIANDYGWSEVFARQVEAHGRPGDLLLAISTSGDSENVARAVRRARELGLFTVGLLGRSGGKIGADVHVALVVPEAPTADGVQGVHIQLIHAVIDAAEQLLPPAGGWTDPRGAR